MFRISKRFTFEAAHRLEGLPPDHPCSRLHGHSYVVELHLCADSLNKNGFVVDYNDLRVFGDWLNATVDHQYLNDLLQPTTAEELARWFFQHAERLLVAPLNLGFGVCLESVVVRETATTTAEYQP